MALNVSILSIPLPIFLSFFILVLAAIIVLTVIEIRLAKKAKEKKEIEDTYYQKKLSAVIALQSDQSSFIISLDKLVREFFSERVGLNNIGKYSELIEKLKANNLNREAAFCQKMQEVLYSGEKLDKSIIKNLLEEISYHISKKEKLGQKASQEKLNYVFSKSNFLPKQTQINLNILKYLREGKKRGFEMSALKEKLIQAGFSEQEIETAQEFVIKENEEKAVQYNTEKKILTNFFNPKKMDLEIIKNSVEEKDDFGKAEIIEIIPYKKIEVEKKEFNYPEKEPEEYKRIANIDDLNRIKNKVEKRR